MRFLALFYVAMSLGMAFAFGSIERNLGLHNYTLAFVCGFLWPFMIGWAFIRQLFRGGGVV